MRQCLCQPQARTADWKVRVADRLIGELTGRWGLEVGDIIVDCGNAYFKDTIRREQACQARGLHFVGAGISGGEEGALEGPSIMPGGSPASATTTR